MSDIKERKVFGLNNFRGLDKENKPLKVETFRATDGENFIIDSGTLKTRPAVKHLKNTSFFLDANEHLIDWYEYKDVIFYVSNFHFYIEKDNEFKNETEIITGGSIVGKLDFSGLNPIFKEEKNCLFIYGLNNIYVFSFLIQQERTIYVLYDLNKFPANPYPQDTDVKAFFDELPIPYEPIIMIGNKTFDDVNLLSNVSKYHLFSGVENSKENSIIFNLPTHFDEEKHGSFDYIKSNYIFEPYKNVYDFYNILPYFMGIENENFYTIGNYGSLFNPSTNTLKILDVYFPDKSFEYFGTSSSPSSTISEIYGLTKEKFFNFRLDTPEKETVFEYMMNLIKTNKNVFETLIQNDTTGTATNRYVKFSLNVNANANFRNFTTNYLVETKSVFKTVDVYVQIKYFDYGDLSIANENVLYNYSTGSTYPSYPTEQLVNDICITGTFGSETPVQLYGDVETDFKTLVKTYIEEHIADVKDTEKRIFGKYFKITTETISNPIVNMELEQFWDKSSIKTVDTTPSYYDYPTNPVDSVDLGTFGLGSGTSFNFEENSSDWIKIRDKIKTNLDLFEGNGGTAFAKLKLYKTSTYQYFDEEGILRTVIRYKTISVVIEFAFSKYSDIEITTLYSMQYSADISADKFPITDNMHSLELSTDKTYFIFKVKNYFFDYRNEPSIFLTVKFEKNEDYNLISKSKFGIVFGSENRIFLAGNEKYPNIDRYNISNDLLGNNVINQSYESTYFPSKNYRLVGGKGAINGYVIATDTQLYITKEDYPNDNKFFIRNRILDNDTGVASYVEYKTNINKTPLNNKCLIRFYNDILMLTKDGLYAIEISANVLTDERLIKLRSGFINKELKNSIKEVNKKDVFILENNYYMYIFIGKNIYVADSRYIANNPNSIIENVSYEIVKWVLPETYKTGHIFEDEIEILETNGNTIYTLSFDNVDDKAQKIENILSRIDNDFLIYETYDYIFENQNYCLLVNGIFKAFDTNHTSQIIYSNNSNVYTAIIIDNFLFRDLNDGDKVYVKMLDGSFNETFINGLEESNRETFNYLGFNNQATPTIYRKLDGIRLYIVWVNPNDNNKFKLLPYKPDEIEFSENYSGNEICVYEMDTSETMLDVVIIEEKPIVVRWLSSITDFGNNLSEKTMFRINLYATKMFKENIIKVGYKTMRRLIRLEDGSEIIVDKKIDDVDSSNMFNLDEIEFNVFSINTFNEFGTSLPAKENNFLYIQFLIIGIGQIELNSLEVIYKNNRMLKSVG